MYWAIGAVENRLQTTSAPFNLQATVQTIGSGVLIGFLQGMAGMTIDPSSITLMTAIDTAGPIVLSKLLGSLTGTSSSIATAAPATAAGSSGSAAAARAVAAAASVPAAVSMPAGAATGQPAGQPILQYSTAYKIRQSTLDFLQLSIPDPTDWTNVHAQIMAAQALNKSDYVVTWSKGCWAHIHYAAFLATNGQYTWISQVIGGAFDPKGE